MPLITHRLRQRPAFDSGHCHDDTNPRWQRGGMQVVRSGLGKPELDFF